MNDGVFTEDRSKRDLTGNDELLHFRFQSPQLDRNGSILDRLVGRFRMETHEAHHEFIGRFMSMHLQVKLGMMKGRKCRRHVIFVHEERSIRIRNLISLKEMKIREIHVLLLVEKVERQEAVNRPA